MNGKNLNQIIEEEISALFQKADNFRKNMDIVQPILSTLTIEKATELIIVLLNNVTPDELYDALIDAGIDHPDALGLDERKKKKKKKSGKKDACYHKVKRNAKVWPSAYASGRLVQCRKVGAANYGNKSKKK